MQIVSNLQRIEIRLVTIPFFHMEICETSQCYDGGATLLECGLPNNYVLHSITNIIPMYSSYGIAELTTHNE